MPEKRPKRITMPGMIYDANQVLEWAMDPKMGGLHPDLFGPGLYGIAFMTIIEAGFIFSGNAGTGIVMAREKDGGWSPPCALGLSGLGMGFIMGASIKHIVYLIYDESTIQSMAGDVGVKLGVQMEASVGAWGRTADVTSMLSNKGLGQNVGLSYSQGLFGGMSLEGAVCAPRSKTNEKFYGQKVCPNEILFQEGAVQVPEGTLMPEILAKLDKLCKGTAIYEPTKSEKLLHQSVREQVDQEGLEALREETIERVDPDSGKTQPVADGLSIFTTVLE